MSIAVLFRIAKIWKKPKHPSMDEWLKKMWLKYTMEYYSAITRVKFCYFEQHGWILWLYANEISQRKKNTI